MSIEERLDKIINDLSQTRQRRQSQEWDALLKSLRDTIEGSFLVANKSFLISEITKGLKDSRSSGACCDVREVGGHSHSRHETVTLTANWSQFRTGQRLTMPASLASGLRTMGFAR